MERARKLLKGLRIHHLGFGFFWTVTFVVLSGFQPSRELGALWQGYTLAEQVLMPAAVGVLGFLCARRRCELPHWAAGAACFLLSGSALLLSALISEERRGAKQGREEWSTRW